MNIYCSKSKAQYTLECIQENRSRSRADEISRIVQEEETEDGTTDISNATDQVSSGITNDPSTTMIDSPTSSLDSGSSDESELDSDDGVNEDVNVEVGNDDNDIDQFINEHDLNNQTKLFASSPLSVRDTYFVIIKLARRLNMNKNSDYEISKWKDILEPNASVLKGK